MLSGVLMFGDEIKGRFMTMKNNKKPCFQGMYAGLLCKCLAFVFAATTATMAYAADWYVDANNGNDTWDGTTATIPTQATIDEGGTIAGPRKTLHAMMSDERVVAGDTVWAAEGDYKEGGTVNGEGTTINRVQVKGGVTLRASGSRENTFITGSGGEYTVEAGATRCVFFLPPSDDDKANGYGYGIVKGFTVRNGRTCQTNEYGGASTGDGLMSECEFKNNGCTDKNRGGTMNGGYAVRCKFTSADRAYQAYNGTYILNSLIEAGGIYKYCKVVNCTFLNSAYVRNSDTWNCLYIGTGAASSSQVSAGDVSNHKNTFSRDDFHATACTTNSTCRVVSAEETPYDSATFRPLAGSVAVDAGGTSYYIATTNKTAWKRGVWLAEASKDYYGNERVVNGTIDVGCGERQNGTSLTIADESDGLVVTGAEKGLSQVTDNTEITFSRTFTSDKLCLGVEINGVFHSFGGTTSDVPYSVTLEGQDLDCYVTAVYETDQKDWYVNSDPSIGDNSNKGYHRNCPRRTLDKAMELATANAGHVVHAAAGIYDSFAEGEEYANANSRVTVKNGVGLVADDWPLKETVIKGASDTTSETKDKYGNGSKAVRCVWVKRYGYVRGFKLTDGRTSLTNDVGTGADDGACGGGAVLISPAALVDCEITGNGTSYRGSAVAAAKGDDGTHGWLIRCYVHDNDANGGNYQIIDRTSLVDSYVDGGNDTAYYCRANSVILNSIIAKGGARAWNTLYAYNSYLSGVSTIDKMFTLNNCAIMGARSESEHIKFNEACHFSVAKADNLDENYCPKTSGSVLVDAGNKDYYDEKFPAQFAQFKGRDFGNGQRVYNGRIDIGCGEYDFRPDFARLLGTGAVISEMGPNVTTNAVLGVVVPEGESIAMSVAPRATDRITQYELAYTPDGGSQTVVSEKSADAFSYELDGPCAVQSLKGYLGFVFHVR